MRVLVALLAAGLMVGIGGNDGHLAQEGSVPVTMDVQHDRSEVLQASVRVALGWERKGHLATGQGTRTAVRTSSGVDIEPGEGDRAYSIRIHGLGSDGVATPAPTPTPAPSPTVQVSRTVAEIICSYSWPCDQALAVARCESGLNPNAWNRTQVWIGGQAHHASGLFQMLMPLHSWRFNGASPFDPEANVRAAHGLWLERGWQPWHASAHCSGVW